MIVQMSGSIWIISIDWKCKWISAYQLNANCGSIRYLFYVEYYSRYVIADTLTNPPNDIYFYCANRGSDLMQCQWSNPDMIQLSDALTRVGGCHCNSQL